jgi:alkylation response protein AidB-like acyl-CoA dehydrogenase
MDFAYDDEQEALRDAVRGLLGKTYADFENRRSATDSEAGFDGSVWQGLAEMGVLGLPFAEEHGGMGAGPVEAGIVAEELGRVLAPEPFLTAVLMAGSVVSAAGTDDQRAELLGGLSEGRMLLALAHHEPRRRWGSPVRVTASEADGGWRLDGVKEPVVQGGRADVLVVSAALPDGGTGVFLVDGDASGVERTTYRTHDGGRAAKIVLSGATATPLGEPGADATAALATTMDGARILAGHEVVGHMASALEATREYLTSRKQFGVPLKTFQALTFRAADMYVDLELTRSTVLWATMVLDATSADGDWAPVVEAASRAGLQVSRAGRRVTQEAIQLHGGIGMTAEYSVGHHLSRITAIEHQLGDGSFHLARLAAVIGEHEEVDPLP